MEYPLRASNQALIADLARIVGTSDLTSWIEEQAETLAAHSWKNSKGLVFSPSLFRERQIQRVQPLLQHHRKISSDAFLEPFGSGYKISYVCSKGPVLKRFAIAHEIGHTYWLQPGPNMKPLSRLQTLARPDSTIEALCDRFAASLLFPATRVRALAPFTGDSSSFLLRVLKLIPILALQFRVTQQLVARRFLNEVYHIPVSLVAARKFGEIWKISWSLLTEDASLASMVAGVSVPAKTSRGRVIPSSWVPETPDRIPQAIDLDGRWWHVVQPHPSKDSRHPFKTLRCRGEFTGYSYRNESRLLIALPLTGMTESLM